MKGLKSIIFGTVMFGLISCRDKPIIVREVKTGNAYLMIENGLYFLKGGEFDFMTDEEHAKRFNENKSAIIQYEVIYEYTKNGDRDIYGNKTYSKNNKSRRLLNVWPADKKID